MDHVPLNEPEPPLPRLHTLVLLVGRMTTIKLAYWAVLTGVELLLPRVTAAPVEERLRMSLAITAAWTVIAIGWAAWSARKIDRRLGRLPRSLATVMTTFAAASVVASPASLPLLLIARQRSIEDCPGGLSCHVEALWLWAATLVVGLIVIPAVFALSLRGEERERAILG